MSIGRVPGATGIQPSIVDAKGDIIAATAADSVSRLAVGNDYGFLQALASESTGLQWNSGGWTTYTPTVAATAGTFTSVSATGRHIRIGKLVVVSVRVVITTNGTAAGLVTCTLPFTPQTASTAVYSGAGRETAATGIALLGYIDANADLRIQKMDGTYPGANGYTLNVTVPYEVA